MPSITQAASEVVADVVSEAYDKALARIDAVIAHRQDAYLNEIDAKSALLLADAHYLKARIEFLRRCCGSCSQLIFRMDPYIQDLKHGRLVNVKVLPLPL